MGVDGREGGRQWALMGEREAGSGGLWERGREAVGVDGREGGRQWGLVREGAVDK